MTLSELFAAYIRDRRQQNIERFTAERFTHLVRFTPIDAGADGLVAYTALEPGSEDRQIKEQVSHFERLGRSFEWKLYDFDEPANLAALLKANLFRPGEVEAFMMCSLAESPRIRGETPAECRLQRIQDQTGIGDVVTVQEQVWARKFGWLAEQLLQTLVRSPQRLSIYCVYAGEQPIATGWTEFPDGSTFPELHGGAVLAEWRRRGLYSKLYDVRMAEARQRGYRYLTVDASPMSRPILEKLGFQYVCSTVPMHRSVAY